MGVVQAARALDCRRALTIYARVQDLTIDDGGDEGSVERTRFREGSEARENVGTDPPLGTLETPW